MLMRQYASPLLICRRGDEESVSKLLPVTREEHAFGEEWFQVKLFDYPNLLPAAEIEPAFHSLEAVARELPLGGNSADLLFANPDGCIALVETKLFRSPEARREVLAQAIDYASTLSGWSYAQFIQAIKQAKGSTEKDPLLEIMRKSAQDGSFDERNFIERVTRNLRLGRILILIVGDEIREEVERMVEFVHRTPHLHFTLGLIEIALFKGNETDCIFVQPRVVGQTRLDVRAVIEIKLPTGAEMKTELMTEKPAGAARTSISEEQFFEELERNSPEEVALAKWAITEAPEHQLFVDWKGSGPILKYRDGSGETFNFGQLTKYGLLLNYWLPKFRELGHPMEIATDYLDDIMRLVPGSARKERGFDKKGKTEIIVYPKGSGKELPLAELARNNEKWFEAIDKAINRIRALSKED
jgi:hypothetical protein